MSGLLLHIVICLEVYRTPEQTYSEEDYIVDGIKMFRLPLVINQIEDLSTDDVRKSLIELAGHSVKQMLAAYREGTPEVKEKLIAAFPRATKTFKEGQPHWYHVTTDASLAKRPTDFNSGGFSEMELLGITDDTEALHDISVYLNSEGDEIEGPPDKFMLSIGAA